MIPTERLALPSFDRLRMSGSEDRNELFPARAELVEALAAHNGWIAA